MSEKLTAFEVLNQKVKEHRKLEVKKEETYSQMEKFFDLRREKLEKLRSFLCLSNYYKIAEKINKEREQLQKFLNANKQTQEQHKKFSLVLDQHYFDQKLMRDKRYQL